MTKELKDIM